jgi:phage/plasmid-associated DNA primase
VKNKQGVSLKSNRVLRKSYDNENQQMELYLKKYDKKEGAFKVKYNLPAHKWGRINPEKSLSLCVFHRPTRHAYCQGIYIDIDMKNAHPVIVKNICLLNNIPCSTITKYCEDRDAFLQRVCDYHNVDRASAKTLMLRLTYGGEYAKWLDSEILKQQRPYNGLAEIVKYEAEMENIRNLVFENNTHIIADVEKADPSYFKNPKYKTPEDVLRKKKKTCMSHFCNTIERHLQEACIKYLVDNKGFDLFKKVPCQDGFMILFDLWYDDILKELEQVVFNKIGFNVELVVKEFDEACKIPVTAGEVEQPEEDGDEDNEIDEPIDDADFKETDKIIMDSLNKAVNVVKEGDNKIYGFTDYDLAKVVHHYYGGLFVCCDIKDNKWYEFRNHRWLMCDNGTTLRNFISEELRQKYLSIANKLTEINKVKKSKTIDRKLHIIGTITEKLGKTNDKNNIMRECRELFYKRDFEEQLNMNVNLLCFTNGVFDYETLEFRDGKPEDMCSLNTNIDLKALNAEETQYMEDVKRRLFYEPLGQEVGDYFLLTIAQALAGKRLKRIEFGLGGTNRGKSTVTTACMSSFGDYAGSFNAENLAYRNTSQDEAQIMRWALLLRHKRIIFSNEMKSTVELNGNMIKKISSGGDRIIGRSHCKEETAFVCDFLAVCMSNDLNNIKPYDEAVSKRVRIIPYEKEFVDEPTNEMELKNDPNLAKEMETELFKQVFLSMVILRYDQFVRDENGVEVEPEEVINAKRDWTGDDGGKHKHVKKFLEDYEITNNENDYIVSKVIETWMESKNFGISYILFTKELKAYCGEQHFNTVKSKVKKVCGKTPQVWVGIRERQYNPEEEVEIEEVTLIEE